MDNELKKKYLQNPFINLSDKAKKQLGITTQDVEALNGGVALELDDTTPHTSKQVVKRKRQTDADSR